MRLNRLDLTRYGKFTDHVIDFGGTAAGAPDFHIIYGLNEAGKSTTFAAFLDLLFGMHTQSPYNFLHPYSSMRIGAQLEIDGVAHELARLKQRNGSLVDARGGAVNDALLTAALGGISRDGYRTMFSLDDQSLREGGEAIVQSRGELGELLFSASSGLAGFSKALVSAADEAASVYKKRSSSTKLAELKRALDALKTERNAIDTFATAHAALTATYQQARIAYDAAASELAEGKTRHAGLTRILAALPLAAERARLAADPANCTDLPRPPAEWFSLLPQLSMDETRLQALLGAAERNAQQLATEIDGLALDENGLAIAAHTEMLANGAARFRAAETDLPKRRLAHAEQDGMLARLLADLEIAADVDPETLLLPASTTAIIRELIEKRSGVDAELASARRELKRAQDAFDRLQEENKEAQQAGAPVDADILARIEAVLVRMKASDVTSRLSVEERARAQWQRNLDDRMGRLAPWSGDVDDLGATNAVDTRQIEAWRSQAMTTDRRMTEHRNRQRDLVTEEMAISARIDAFAAGGAIDDTEALALRAERETAWQQHVAALDKATAQDFEARMRRDDVASAGRLAHAHDLAELRQLKQKAIETAAAIQRQKSLFDEAQEEYSAISDKVGGFLPATMASETDTLERLTALESWTIRRTDALAAVKDLNNADMAIAEIRTEIEHYRVQLQNALADAGFDTLDTADIGNLARTADTLVSHAREQATARSRHEKFLSDLSRDLAGRERDEKEAQSADENWKRAWQEALSRTWLADKASSVAAVREILLVLAKLPGILKERQELSQRVAAMERDQTQFRSDLSRLVGRFEDVWDVDEPLATSGMLLERHKAALRSREIRADKQAELEKLNADCENLAGELSIHNARKAELTAYFGTDTLASVAEFLDQARERERIQNRIAALQEQIVQSLRAADFEEAERRLSEIDADGVERDAMELSARIDDLTERARLLYADTTRAKDKLDAVGGDDGVARIEAKRKTIFLEIEDLAGRYLTIRAGILAAEQALRIYREKHRSSMMNRASEAFRLITGGNYSSLATQLDKDKEILIGVARDGGSKLADTMSTGTQFQLYLALRLAGYEEFAAVRPSVPFVADDIMESFDNPRSEEVFRLLGEMSKVGQVIYLTHHWHLCEIAKTVVPQVKIHQLP